MLALEKKTITKFTKNEHSQCHKDAVLKTITLSSTSRDVNEILTYTASIIEMSQRWKCFLKPLSHACFLAIAFRGDGEENNFIRLVFGSECKDTVEMFGMATINVL